MIKAVKYTLIAVLMAVLMTVSGVLTLRRSPLIEVGKDTPVDCVIALKGNPSHGMALSTGFHYELLRKAQALLGHPFEIRLCGREESILDSLKEGKITLAVLPAGDSALRCSNGLICSRIFPDSAVWVVAENGIISSKALKFTVLGLEGRGDWNSTIERFTPSYEPFSRIKSRRHSWPCASPYDELIKTTAKGIGWDWRMLAAVVWQESRFRIEARSHRGAEGLMQVMPYTARYLQGDDVLLDPERNLEAGASYLRRLMRLFSGDAASEDELMRITLAAYNAGEGRIRECLTLARAKGLAGNKWDDIKAIIPDLRDGDVMIGDSVVIGTFQGYETIAYVARTDSLYQAFKIIVP